MKKILFISIASILFLSSCEAQKKTASTPPSYTPGTERVASGQQLQNMGQNSPFAAVPFRCVGPTVMSGRVVDVDVNPDDPTHFYVAYASGGLWVTHNNGTTFTPLFQEEMVMTIGDIAVDWYHGEVIWIGTGENNSSRSSYSGVGIFKSYDQGKTWVHSGLSESHHIGRIVLDPNNPKTAWVAVLGHLYTNNKERGIYKTEDGGETWTHVYQTGENAGIIDLVVDPVNSNEVYASVWERSRAAWNFTESGKSSDVIFSDDGGLTWTSLVFPNAEVRNSSLANGLGRIGLSMHHSLKGRHLYAIVDNQNHREKKEDEEDKKDVLKKSDFKEISRETFLALDDKKLECFLRDNGFPDEHTAQSVKKQVEKNEIKATAIYDYLFDANEDLFDTPVIGAEVYKYSFDTKTWTRTHLEYLDDLVYTYGYYFGLIRTDPSNPDKIYIAGVPLLRSDDGGANFKLISPDNVHGDHHALWINPDRPGHLINGSDGGVQISYDDGESFVNCNTPEVGQFYAIAVDDAKPYNVYGGLQDNGVWVGSSRNKPNRDWYQSGKYPFEFLMGGDGMQVQVDTRNNNTLYTGYQFGWYSRIERSSGYESSVRPIHKLGERPLRWNWQTPILLSRWNQDIFYICSNRVHRSFDKGETFETISSDLTMGGQAGDVPFGTITTIAESPKTFGILAVGSDDGLVHISKDAGQTWTNISAGLPSGFWVSRVVLSAHEKNRMYVSLNGYRNDNMTPMVFVSENAGVTWKNISTGLPMGPVNVIREDPAQENLLFLGTDHGLFVSIDRGLGWSVLGDSLPNVPVHDLAIQAREKDLVVGTHGRSIWIGDLEELEQVVTVANEPVTLLDLKSRRWSSRWGNKDYEWAEPTEAKYMIPVFFNSEQGVCDISIYSDSLELMTFTALELKKGINYIPFDLSLPESSLKAMEEKLNANIKEGDEPAEIKKADNDQYYLPAGEYIVKLKMNGVEQEKQLELEE